MSCVNQVYVLPLPMGTCCKFMERYLYPWLQPALQVDSLEASLAKNSIRCNPNLMLEAWFD